MRRFLPLLLLLSACGSYQPTKNYTLPATPPNELSENLLQGLRAGEDVEDLVREIATLEPTNLAAGLDTRDKQLAF